MIGISESYRNRKEDEREARRPGSDGILQFAIEYEYHGRTWRTVVDAYDRESAVRQFKRDNPGVRFLGCYEEE